MKLKPKRTKASITDAPNKKALGMSPKPNVTTVKTKASDPPPNIKTMPEECT